MTHNKLITVTIRVINIGRTMLTFDYEEPQRPKHHASRYRELAEGLLSKGGRLGGMRQTTCDAESEFLKPHCFR